MSKCVIAGNRRFPSLGLNEPDDWRNPDLKEVIYNILEEEIAKSGFQIGRQHKNFYLGLTHVRIIG